MAVVIMISVWWMLLHLEFSYGYSFPTSTFTTTATIPEDLLILDPPTTTRTATYARPKSNPRYPDLPFDNYLSNPYFHKINLNYPGLQLVHENPFIFIVNDFFTNDECNRLINKAMTGPILRKQIGGGNVERTSTGIVCENEEVPTIRSKMAELTQITDLRQLQPLKVSRYEEGQTFSKHTDAWPTENAPISRGWVNEEDFFGDTKRPTHGCYSSRNKPLHNNFMTSFVYLNDVPVGGCTSFPNIGIHTGKNGKSFYEEPSPMDTRFRFSSSSSSEVEGDGQSSSQLLPWDWNYGSTLRIHPKKGMAVLHFCSTLPEYGGICDGNTFHVAEPPQQGMEKFVSQQFFASCPKWDIPDDSMPIGIVSNDVI